MSAIPFRALCVPLVAGCAPLLAGCALHAPPGLASLPNSVVVTSGGPNSSAIYAARVDGGVILIDLGWWGAETALEKGLAQLGSSAEDVIAVFLTHSHRDHLGAWRMVQHARFHVAESEVDLLFGRRQHGGWIARWADNVMRSDLPVPGEVTVRPFATDTSFAFGSDTLRAFLVPGHTAGSAAYLFRGDLFAGDAIAKTWLSGFRQSRGGYSEDTDQALRSLETLRERLAPHEVRWVCSAHLKCSAVTDEFWADLLWR